MFVDDKEAIVQLKAAHVVALPTETVYGLAADATQDQAVAEIFALKQRPQFNPLISHYVDVRAVKQDVEFSPLAQKLADAFWPGPLTMVLPQKKRSRLATLTCAGLPTAAVRVPQHPQMQQILQSLDFPLAAPSANVSGRLTTTTAQHVAQQFADELPILDGGPCILGLESTIIDLTHDTPTILRAGGLSTEDIIACIGQVAYATADAPVKAPGMLLRHYAPQAKLVLDYPAEWPPQAVLLHYGAKPANLPDSVTCLCLGYTDKEAAACLFTKLHEADALNPPLIVAPLLPPEGLGKAINDRLERAARG